MTFDLYDLQKKVKVTHVRISARYPPDTNVTTAAETVIIISISQG